jgi:hypothetical protein
MYGVRDVGVCGEIDRMFGRLESDRRVEGALRRDEDSSIVADGMLLFLSPDQEADRISFRAQLNGPMPSEIAAVAPLTSAYNSAHFHETGMSMGIATREGAVLVGRSIEIDEAEDVGAMLDELVAKIRSAQQYLDRELNRIRNEEKQRLASTASDMSPLMRV